MPPITTQEDLPGVETPKVAAIEKAAKNLYEVRSERQQLTQKECEAADKLLTLMEEHELEVYACRSFQATVKVKPGKTKVSVKLPASADDDDD